MVIVEWLAFGHTAIHCPQTELAKLYALMAMQQLASLALIIRENVRNLRRHNKESKNLKPLMDGS